MTNRPTDKPTNRLGLVLLFLFSIPALAPLLTSTPTRSADGLLHLYRLVQLATLWRNGIFFSRWLPDLAYGYGMPLFNYYAPLAYYLTAPLHFIGIPFSLALNVSIAAAMLVGAVGMFCFTRAVLPQKFETQFLSPKTVASENGFVNLTALISALAYLYSPYILFNALHRGNLAEQWALAFAPFALWRFFVLMRNPNGVNWSLAVLTFATVMLSHNVTSFLFAPLLFFFTLACIISNASHFTFHVSPFIPFRAGSFSFLIPLSALFLSLSLSAFFWLPALLERDFVQIARVIVTPDFDYRFNFVSPSELVSILPRADTGRMNPAFPSTLGFIQVVLAVSGILFLAGRLRSRRALPFFSLAITAAGFIVLMLPMSKPLWDTISLLSFVQLPMRLRGLVALCLAPLIGIFIFALPMRWRMFGVCVAISAIVLSALPMLYPRYARDVPLNPTLTDMFAYEQRAGALGTTSFGEYLPVWVQNPPDTSPFAETYARGELPDRFVLPENVSVCGGGIYPTTQIVCASSQGSWRIIYRAFYFPGWRAYVNRRPVEIEPTPRTGLISFEVSDGELILLTYAGTEIEHIAEWISIASAILVLVVFGFGIVNQFQHPTFDIRHPTFDIRHPTFDIRFPTLLFFLAFALLAFKIIYIDRVSNPFVAHFDGARVSGISQIRDIKFGGAMQLLGFDVNATELKRGETLDTMLYWRALPGLQTNLSTFVHLTAPDGFVLAQDDNLHPANLPTTQWDLDAYAADAHAFQIPATLAPGMYELRAGVYEPRTNARLKTADGADSILLDKITVE